jgi:hypothetical protein
LVLQDDPVKRASHHSKKQGALFRTLAYDF